MIAPLPPLLATYDGADYERRGDAVWRVEIETGKEQRWCHVSEWDAAQERLEEAARRRRIRIVTLAPVEPPPPPEPPKLKRDNGRSLSTPIEPKPKRKQGSHQRKRTPATPEIIERLRSAPAWQCAACGVSDGRMRSLKDNRYCKRCARRRPIAGAQPE